ncbi:MAG: amylo-alpha-1,6-glucosidase [Paludibacter sp.]|nr:amylo-alpha-1,6-glucosidase [Paludibacter sp.]
MKLTNNKGLTFSFLENGNVQNIDADKIRINLKSGNPFVQSGTQIYLRKRNENQIEFTSLLGFDNEMAHSNNQYYSKGEWKGLKYVCSLQLSDKSNFWQWKIDVTNTTSEKIELDVVLMQEVGLKNLNDGLVNEYYVAQYLERILLDDAKHGTVAVCRQNTKEATGYPWLMMASVGKAISGLTDGMQFYGNSYRSTGIPEGLLQSELSGNIAGESPIIALQEKPFELKSNENKSVKFVSAYLSHHSEATSDKDLSILDDVIAEFKDIKSSTPTDWTKTKQNLFQTAPFFPSSDLTGSEIEKFFGKDLRLKEQNGKQLLSFFSSDNKHVILKAKEVLVDRPHAHIMQANLAEVPREETLSTTCFATGVFNSHISQGNTNFNVFLSINTSQFNANLNSGQRIFVEINDKKYLLGIPSAFEMGLNICRWIYKWDETVLEVKTETYIKSPVVQLTFNVLNGNAVKLIITHDWDKVNTWNLFQTGNGEFEAKPTLDSMISEKFSNADFRMVVENPIELKNSLKEKSPYGLDDLFVLETSSISHFTMQFVGEVKEKFDLKNLKNQESNITGTEFWGELSNYLTLKSSEKNLSAINEILPWYGMNAITHYLTPYGLEQFSGAAWGTRDVSQGPIEFLLSLEKFDAARKVLLTIFTNQNSVGDWPQWWMFDSYSHIRASDCHGDIYYWVIISLASYVKATGDVAVLNEKVPYFGGSELFTINEHTERLIQMIEDSYIGETALVPFGGGDWNDSLQPKNEDLAKRLISSWTVEMNYEAFNDYVEVYEKAGNQERAKKLKEVVKKIKSDFNKYLVKNNVVAGYGYVEDNGDISVLLHPTDTHTGISYSLLPMDRGILSGIFTKEQAEYHQTLIDKHLKGPDGARLMDKPMKYKGGIQEIFQRAESSTFFGREIGLMYIHEHIRYAESQAVLGKADEFVKALRQAIPVNYKDIVPNSNLRQVNCYYSSSDVTFKTRYEADEKYADVLSGKMRVDGGWRVYSSGPGIYVSLIIKKLIGFRAFNDYVVIDPVLTNEMDGFSASFKFKGHHLNWNFKVKSGNFTPKSIIVNGLNITFDTEDNPYRIGGALISMKVFLDYLKLNENKIIVEI